ncbi:hypothetical protein [Fundidesulfovibrio soli]|uniref:hypothetical protein n=1 Tax=Fundidesulfovibrio soli TaxID=2922716 RepID=UPI001FB02BA5|nr:hypothetical protein [Fundidesulfovibrio soli]
MTSDNRRADFRIGVPAHYVRQMAVWPCADLSPLRLGLTGLGAPLLLQAKREEAAVRLLDISIQGLGLCVDPSLPGVEALVEAAACHIYLKLWDPSVEQPYGVLSVFTSNRIVRVVRREDALFLGTRFVRFAVGSRMEKALEFLDAQVCGVSALAHWCDNLSRGGFAHPGQARNGLDLDNLLAELSYVIASAGGAGLGINEESK